MTQQERILAVAKEIGPADAWGDFDKKFGSPANQANVRNMWFKIAERAIAAVERHA